MDHTEQNWRKKYKFLRILHYTYPYTPQLVTSQQVLFISLLTLMISMLSEMQNTGLSVDLTMCRYMFFFIKMTVHAARKSDNLNCTCNQNVYPGDMIGLVLRFDIQSRKTFSFPALWHHQLTVWSNCCGAYGAAFSCTAQGSANHVIIANSHGDWSQCVCICYVVLKIG